MFLNLDNILKNTRYRVSDDEIVKASKNLGYVSIAETKKETKKQNVKSRKIVIRQLMKLM